MGIEVTSQKPVVLESLATEQEREEEVSAAEKPTDRSGLLLPLLHPQRAFGLAQP